MVGRQARTAQSQASSSGVRQVTFADPGAIGLSFGGKREQRLPWLRHVRPGTAASAPELELSPGLLVLAVNGRPIQNFSDAMRAIKRAGRPLTLSFKPNDGGGEDAAARGDYDRAVYLEPANARIWAARGAFHLQMLSNTDSVLEHFEAGGTPYKQQPFASGINAVCFSGSLTMSICGL